MILKTGSFKKSLERSLPCHHLPENKYDFSLGADETQRIRKKILGALLLKITQRHP